MFEKSLYHLIKGIRHHKRDEKEYVLSCLKECRAEIRTQDLNLKATALLKLIYLEMLGHDMSWASFHVLEVMSSTKYHQKRVGYLGAVQSFRPDTEVLMLATNLLKKDLNSPLATTMQLPILALPHVITPSLALSVASDLLPRLTHTNSNVRKKTIVTLYRLALVYPETLRVAWPKIKERLMDKDESLSVTAAIVNVICELSLRRPSDFLPLAPRLFELLVDADNNWMVIKLIKLFATLTPLEPRLVRKLLPPLTKLIQSTHATSLLYECINGIIQGGILGAVDDETGREQVATLCVGSLRGMILTDGDSNLTYVALLAFNRIVVTHPLLVSQQEDAILACVDSPDITIRIKALDLVQGMVRSENLMLIVGRLMRQLKTSHALILGQHSPARINSEDSDPDAAADSNPSGFMADIKSSLPQEYRVDIIGRILQMCSRNNFGCILDFIWFIDVLVQLVRIAPLSPAAAIGISAPQARGIERGISERIGDELRSVAVKVKAMRECAVRAAALILNQVIAETPYGHSVANLALKAISWLVGEYASQLLQPEDTLGALLALVPKTSSPDILAHALQAILKLFAQIAAQQTQDWGPIKRSQVSLLLARIIHVIEPLYLHPNLEVQERAVEYIELLKLAAEAVAAQPEFELNQSQDMPLLLVQAIPSLFAGWELNSVAIGTQRNVPVPDDLALDEPIHPNLHQLLAESDALSPEPEEPDEFDVYYYQKPQSKGILSDPVALRLPDAKEELTGSYQHIEEDSYLDSDIVARRKAERFERNKEDPFYIQSERNETRLTRVPSAIDSHEKPDLEMDKIPMMKLELGHLEIVAAESTAPAGSLKERQTSFIVDADETLQGSGGGIFSGLNPQLSKYDSETASDGAPTRLRSKKYSLLQLDSSNIRSLSLEGSAPLSSFDFERQKREDAEMARAMNEVERLRLQMQRANERIAVAPGVAADGVTVVARKKPSKKLAVRAMDGSSVDVKKKKCGKILPEVAESHLQMAESGTNPNSSAIVASGNEDELGGIGHPSASVDVTVVAKKKKTTKKKKLVEME